MVKKLVQTLTILIVAFMVINALVNTMTYVRTLNAVNELTPILPFFENGGKVITLPNGDIQHNGVKLEKSTNLFLTERGSKIPTRVLAVNKVYRVVRQVTFIDSTTISNRTVNRITVEFVLKGVNRGKDIVILKSLNL